MGLRDGTKSGYVYRLPQLPPEYKYMLAALPAKYFQTELVFPEAPSLPASKNSTFESPPSEPPAYSKDSLRGLKNTGLFEPSLINHIFDGEVKEKWVSKGKGRRKLVSEATGFHSECIKNHAGSVIDGTRSKPDSHGVYTGQVLVNGVKKKYPGLSTFFPRDWGPQKIVNAINEAYRNREKAGEQEYVGHSNGIKIKIWISPNGKIASAFPIKEE